MGSFLSTDVVESGAILAGALPVAGVAKTVGIGSDFFGASLEYAKANATNGSFDDANTKLGTATAGLFINPAVAAAGKKAIRKSLDHFAGSTQAKGVIPFSDKVMQYADRSAKAISTWATRGLSFIF